jgi:sarcosine oxidase
VVPAGDGVVVRDEAGVESWSAPVAVVAVGAWAPAVAGRLVDLPPLPVTREQPLHFAPTDPGLAWPSFIHHRQPFIYGLETPGEGVKVAEHHTGPEVDPDTRTFDLDPAAAARLQDYVGEWFPGLDPTPVSGTTCLYTTTVTEDFVLDRVGPVVVAAGFSGHGFKFTPELGRLLADLAEGRSPEMTRFVLGAHRRAFRRPAHR